MATSTEMRGKFETAAAAFEYIRAGNATVTIRSKKTDTRFTFRIREKAPVEGEDVGPRGPITFVSLLNGSDNEASYAYLGHFWNAQGVYWHGKKSKVSADAPSARAFDWVYRQLAQGKLPECLEIWHEGSCGRCGRKLTVPASIEHGFGPECIKHVH